MTTPPGRDVLERARRGDGRAFGVVVEAYGALVLNLAWRIVRQREEAEDLVQEVFLHLVRVFPRYDPERPFVPWLRRVAVNLIRNRTAGKARRLRRGQASLDRIREEAGDAFADPGAAEGGDAAAGRERAERVRAAVAGLPPDQREILALRYFGGRSYDDLARDLGIPMGTVKNRLFRARAALAGRLGDIGEEIG